VRREVVAAEFQASRRNFPGGSDKTTTTAEPQEHGTVLCVPLQRLQTLRENAAMFCLNPFWVVLDFGRQCRCYTGSYMKLKLKLELEAETDCPTRNVAAVTETRLGFIHPV
jgi:hypothetical protein